MGSMQPWPFGHQDAVLVYGICGIRRDHHVARTDGRKKQVGERVLGADGDDGFLVGIEFHAVVVLVARGDFLAQARNAARLRIAMIARVARRLDQLVDHHARRGAVGVAHPHIDHIDLRGPRLGAHFVDDREHVGGQLLYAIEILLIFGHYFLFYDGPRRGLLHLVRHVDFDALGREAHPCYCMPGSPDCRWRSPGRREHWPIP
jgi:hypothetical protein